MENKNVNKLVKALGLKRRIVGVKFIYFESEYKKIKLDEWNRKTSYCIMVKNAMEGKIFKACQKHFACRCSYEALGIGEEMDCVESGQRYMSIGLYKDIVIAKAVTKNIARIKHKVYGIALGPLELLKDADVVLMMATPYQLMRIIEGYAYNMGTPLGITSAGNQGICADMTAVPFEYNRMNYSVLCAGTRKMCHWEDDEMGVGIPVHMFNALTEGVVSTLNYIEYPERKQTIRERLSSPDELGIEIKDELHYGKLGKEYTNPELYNRLKNGDNNA